MNNQLIEKLITCNDESCPEFTYSNPLLDRNVTRALSKSFVKLLNISKKTNSNSSLRQTVLENIREACKIQPEGHTEVNEDVTELLKCFYQKQMKSLNSSQNIDKKLEEFLIRRWKESNYDTSHKPNVNPEVAQALINLDENVDLEIIEDIIHWNQHDRKYTVVLNVLWNTNIMDGTFVQDDKINHLFNDTSIKIKSQIEKWLLDIAYSILDNNSIDLEGNSSKNCNNLIKSCSRSKECFQMCISILNSIFIKTNFNLTIQKFISTFIERINMSTKVTISVLYPIHLSNLVILLDINLDELPDSFRHNYVTNSIKYLRKLSGESENDFIMLLSHFPQWYCRYIE